MTDTKPTPMTYRFLGNSGLLVFKLSLGTWMDVMMKLAFERAGLESQAYRRGYEGVAEEETVRAMNYVINPGWAFYWGTSQWSAAEIIEACEIADRLGLIRHIVEQTI
ncbi:voltage-gated potassium channel subunit beta-2 [Phytophthora nicotianae INRA-310]|uniref:Voltage-gated potassium channel subunit beta-2 n=1 Tax=Phytophthora nicotianae (strain INRA-310) TaxID=761204 RepID=W2PI92_PHYN3|nr:voltage-gated potassium channel subunit beta-2 [Phytophthora nicotianae INRA-310]ETM99744.1 voltage-gated potassium channel subunit beta-2 [Phytophthora nicotianae INRA-310]